MNHVQRNNSGVKLSDYLVEYIHHAVAPVVFGYQGSSVCHLIDSIHTHPGMTFVESRHEQGAAFAANAYAQLRHSAGIALGCSGPGAINLVAGIANAFFDSVPCLFLCGQVSTRELRTDERMRQFGFQETDIVSIVKPITKYAVQIRDPQQIAYELEKAVSLMRAGRPGPVLLDIPHDIQRSNVDVARLQHYAQVPQEDSSPAEADLEALEASFNSSKRPVIVLGGGCAELNRQPEWKQYLAGLNVPVVVSYRGRDIWTNGDPNYGGVIGAYGNRSANWAVYHSDALLCIGTRLDGRQTGGDLAAFAPGAQKFVVDIDPVELDSKECCSVGIRSDVIAFLRMVATRDRLRSHDGRWASTVDAWCARMPASADYRLPGINPNAFMERVGRIGGDGAIFTTDVGQNQIWTNASLFMGRGSRLLQSCGLGSMGYALPAAVGAGFAAPGHPIVCFSGDGGFQMNVQELQTIRLHDLPVKAFVFNNRSLGLIRIYQQKAMGGRVPGSVTGFGSPEYEALAKAYGFEYARVAEEINDELLAAILNDPNPVLVEVCVSDQSTCCPEPTYMRSVENQSPLLSAEDIEEMRKDVNRI